MSAASLPHGALRLTDAQAWTDLTPTGVSPTARRFHSAVYDSVGDRMVVFGGDAPGVLNDVWALGLSGTPSWTDLTPTGTSPSGRYSHGAIYDPGRDRMVVFGGLGDSFSILGDVWALSLTGTPAWTQLTPDGTPPSARYAHSTIYDPVGDRVIVFGGLSTIGGGDLNDVWALSLTGTPTWMELTPGGTPPIARYGHRAIYDRVRDRMVLFGGLYYDGITDHPLSDVWALSLAGSPTWTELTPSGTPPNARDSHAAVYDPVRDRMVTFGGREFSGSYLNDVRALSLAGTPAWAAQTPGGTPPAPRYAHSMVYDSARDRIVVYGGDNGSGTVDDVWALGLNEASTAVALVALNAETEPGRVRILWYASGDEIVLASVYRRTSGGDWALLGNPQFEPNGSLSFEDTTVSSGVQYGYRLVVRDVLGTETTSSETWVTVPGDTAPSGLRFLAITPNPYGATGQLKYGLPRGGRARLAVYDSQGRRVASVVDRVEPAGWRSAVWDGRDGSGRLLPSGTYFARLEAGGEILVRKLVLLR